MAGLRAVVADHTAPEVHSGTLLEAIRPVTRLARARGVSATQVILAAKEVWAAVPEARERIDPVHHARQLEQLVSVCVEGYFAD